MKVRCCICTRCGRGLSLKPEIESTLSRRGYRYNRNLCSLCNAGDFVAGKIKRKESVTVEILLGLPNLLNFSDADEKYLDQYEAILQEIIYKEEKGVRL